MTEINLDDLGRARLEAVGKKRHVVVFKGKRFQLPVELPLTFQVYLARGDTEEALRALFDGKAPDFLALNPSAPDYVELANQVAQLYVGMGTGESSASGASSKSTSRPSRRTSNGSTR